MRTLLLTVAAVVAWAAEPVVTDLPVQDGDLVLTGRYAAPVRDSGKAPAVLVVHEWWGRNAYAERRAVELARLGYAAVAVDCYGEPASPDFPTAVRRSAPFYQDPSLFTRRITPFLAALRAKPEVDGQRVAAIGFCFGGSAVLQLARSGADLKAVVAFHPGLKTAAPATAKPLAAILVAHGGADPFVPPADVAGFFTEMTAVKADWQMAVYGGAVHAFTNPEAGQGVTNVPAEVPFAQAVAHDAAAEAGSMAAMRAFLAERLR
jgi:dienelactone hydrolase